MIRIPIVSGIPVIIKISLLFFLCVCVGGGGVIRIPQAKFFRSPDATGRKFPGCWNPESCTDGFF